MGATPNSHEPPVHGIPIWLSPLTCSCSIIDAHLSFCSTENIFFLMAALIMQRKCNTPAELDEFTLFECEWPTYVF